MIRPAPARPWTALTIGAVVSVLAADVLGARAELSVAAAGLGLAALAAHGTAKTRSGLPCAAVALAGSRVRRGHPELGPG